MSAAVRTRLPDASEDALHFAQVREDPELEIRALAVGAGETAVVVGSGGCTALSLLAAGAGRVVAVDVNPAQNHLLELKLAAVTGLSRARAVRFLGGWDMPAAVRLRAYRRLRPRLSPAAREYWDARSSAVGRGVLEAGTTERYLRVAAALLRWLVHPARRIRRLLACATLDEQRAFFAREWNNRRWRALFALVGGKAALRRVYRPDFFRHARQARFAEHFRERLEHTLTRIPVGRNYFLHQLLTGRYPADPAALPPYLADAHALRGAAERLRIVDGGYTSFLATLTDASVDAFALSNICEWMPIPAIDALFAEIRRTARPGARLVLRNFVGWTEVPEPWRAIIVEDRTAGAALMAADRALFQRRIAPCVVRGEAA